MRVHVVSDVHGAAEALARAGDGADALIVLGDLVHYVDYRDPESGILGRVLGPEVSAEFARLRRTGGRDELIRFIRDAWARIPDAPAVVEEAVLEQYDRLFGALTAPTYAIPGNVDMPRLWPRYARPGLTLADGQVLEIGGLRFGFVGGVPLPPGVERRASGPWTPHLLPADEYAAAVKALDRVDVLCSHTPPAVPELAYDVVTRRAEASSPELLDVIQRDRPRAALFGHVHQPLAPRVRVGRTECVNVGHFRATGTPYVLRW
ncbi:MAG TPA: metallophosphoesterase [Pseudonocardia sp.]|jgi:Icc-related predicted phosphoesterase|uniref:metallophosphoesterase family protein n=1 Tax=Pseudonocardia sp. TaxID=60912 RepID=UPI002B4AE74F|nr:metallophosphoesterase [Pseudonocardia sp.]HLU59060.1 metallophosphoesterase [Pseudonocardia sp.]